MRRLPVLIPHRPGCADFPLPVLHGRASLVVVYRWTIRGAGRGQRFAAILFVRWTYSTQNELPLLSSLCAANRRGGTCRPMQVTVRIRASTARDEQDWQGH